MNEFKYKEANAVVVGGGITGCSIAYELAKRSQSVVLLEKNAVGQEASGRNAGSVRQQIRNPAELPLAMAAVAIWKNLESELDWDLEYRQNGHLRLIETEEELDRARKGLEREQQAGLEVQFLDPAETRSFVPALSRDLNIFGATYCPSDGTANPLVVTKAIARAAIRSGVQINEYTPLKELKVESGRVVAAIAGETEYRAGVFINAAGPWARSLCNQVGLDFPVDIKKTQILVTEAFPPLIKGHISFDTGYVNQTPSGGIVIGIRSIPTQNFDKSTTLQAFFTAGKHFPPVVPLLKRVKIVRSWAGITHWTPDAIPVIDKAPGLDGLFLAAGFSGHGFCLGPIVGKLMAEWIVDGKPSIDLKSFSWNRFL